jgi:hypothetical protein
MLKFLNGIGSFELEPYMYAWIYPNLLHSFSSLKIDIYDKFAIVNLVPKYDSETLVNLIIWYLWTHIFSPTL